jgi:NADH dehydrogenase
MPHRVVIVGGGFGGLNAARRLGRAPVDLVLIDRRNFHLFQPLLYQVATGALSPGEIASPLRHVLHSNKNTAVVLGEVVDFDPELRQVVLKDSSRVPYDTLVFGTGSTHSYFGHPEWSSLAPGLKTVEDATEIRTRILLAFERAEKEKDPAERRANLTFVVVGAGPTGVELAGAMAEISRDTLRQDFRSIDPAESAIFLIEGADRVLPSYPPKLSAAAERSLIKLGVQPRINTRVTGIDETGVRLEAADGKQSHIESRTVLWGAGVQASPVGHLLAKRTGVSLDKAGRVNVNPDLTVPGHPEIFVIGDLVHLEQDGHLLPGVAPAAIQMGTYVAKTIRRRLEGKPVKPFHYFNKGSLATIGRNSAVAEVGRLKFSGYFAWLTWLFVHLLYIVEFENRLLIVVQWAYDYFTHNRGARLITGVWASSDEALGPKSLREHATVPRTLGGEATGPKTLGDEATTPKTLGKDASVSKI